MIRTPVRRRIEQLAIGILAVLSLSVSSVGACMCSHHEPVAQAETRSCHGPAKTQHNKKSSSAERHASFGESCNCVPPSTNLSVKAEGFKLKKHPAAAAETVLVSPAGFYSPVSELKEAGPQHTYRRRSDRPPSSRGPPLS
jgi:hypothetical protein